MLTSIFLSLVVLAGIIFFIACFDGFHRTLAEGNAKQVPVSSAFVQHVRMMEPVIRLNPKVRIISLSKAKPTVQPSTNRSKGPQKGVVIPTQRKCL